MPTSNYASPATPSQAATTFDILPGSSSASSPTSISVSAPSGSLSSLNQVLMWSNFQLIEANCWFRPMQPSWSFLSQDLELRMFQYRFSGLELIDGKAGVRGGESRTFGQEFAGQFQFERSRSRSLTAPFGVLLNCKEMNL